MLTTGVPQGAVLKSPLENVLCDGELGPHAALIVFVKAKSFVPANNVHDWIK